MSGAVAATALTADLAFFYRREVAPPPRFELVGGRTATGIADVSRGISDIGLTAAPADRGRPAGLVFTPFARTGICLVTNSLNPVPGSEPGADPGPRRRPHHRVDAGAGLAARRSDRAPALTSVGGGSRTRVRGRDASTRPRRSCTRRAPSPPAPQMRDYLKVTPNAWGYVDLAFAGDLHVVPFEGIPCTRATVASERLPGPHGARVRHARRARRAASPASSAGCAAAARRGG